MAQKTLFLNIIFILAISFSIWLMLHNNAHLSTKTAVTNQMNAFMHDVTYVEYNQAGHLHSKLSASQITYYAKNVKTYLTDPRIQIYSEQGTPWHIDADFGKSEQGTEKIHLWQDVIINTTDQQSGGVTTIKTNEMTIYPQQSIALTKSPVTITRPGVIIHGVGLETNFKTKTSKILTQAQSSYDPTTVH